MQIKKNNNLVCIVKIKVKEDKIQQVLEIFYHLATKSLKEDNCLSYKIHQDTTDSSIFTFVEKFTDENAFEIHCEEYYIKNYFNDILPSLIEEIIISTHNEIEISQ